MLNENLVRLLNWLLMVAILLIMTAGIIALFSAAQGHWHPWASRQLIHFALGFLVMVGVAVIDIRVWFRYAYPLYALTLLFLVLVDLFGTSSKGAQRWFNLGFVHIQPSEFLRISLVLVLAKYFHTVGEEKIGQPLRLVIPTLLLLVPTLLVLKQPDLGTALMLMTAGVVMFFAAGVRGWVFVVVCLTGMATVPTVWSHLHSYQQKRLEVFLNPAQDSSGAGYNIIQSEIALGSGGFLGKGFLKDTQSRLGFLPEKNTDFIFSLFGEQFGFMGGLVLIALYASVVVIGLLIATTMETAFARLMILGVVSLFFIYAFTNIAMVIGLMPVVGVPLPLVSYGGTSSVVIQAGIGFILNGGLYRTARASDYIAF